MVPPPLSGIGRTIYGIIVDLTEPVLRLVRGLLPPIRMGTMALDLSPIIVFIALGIIRSALCAGKVRVRLLGGSTWHGEGRTASRKRRPASPRSSSSRRRSAPPDPADVQQKVFRLAFRGYNERDVDEFLDEVTESLAEMHEENKRLREQLQDAGGSAGATAAAQRQAEAIIQQAREQAAGIGQGAPAEWPRRPPRHPSPSWCERGPSSSRWQRWSRTTRAR